ncbi:MAG: hypothetical protein LJE95_10450 [Acidobacteria bacterium]|nr:hypothetical protein [Acidobacteriota bacterium]
MTVWSDRVSPLFDVSQRALLLTIRSGRVVEQEEVALPFGTGEEKLAFIRRLRADTVLCGAVSQVVAAHAVKLGLRLIPFVAGQVEDVLSAYTAGQLPKEELSMPGWHAEGVRKGSAQGTQPSDGALGSKKGSR